MQSWKRIEPTTVTKVGWRKIVSKSFETQGGKQMVFDTVHSDGQQFVGVIALTTQNEVIIARQFRPGPERIMEELPGGFVDVGESPEVSCRRELLEETGYEAGSMLYLGQFHKDTYMNAVWHIFLARDCTATSGQDLEFEEDIEIDLISIDQLIENSKTDKMTDHASVLIAYDQLRAIMNEREL